MGTISRATVAYGGVVDNRASRAAARRYVINDYVALPPFVAFGMSQVLGGSSLSSGGLDRFCTPPGVGYGFVIVFTYEKSL